MGSTDPTAIVVLVITSIISSVCSGWVILRAKDKLDQPYQRLLMIMSILDVITSFRYATLLHVPGDEPSVACTMDGFSVAFFGLLAALYPSCLQLYFLLTVRFGVSQQRYQKYYEPVLLLLPSVYCLAVSIAGVVLDMFNPSVTTTPGCFVNEYPGGCGDSPEIDCERGQNADFFSLLLVAPVVLGWFCIIVCNVMIYLRFRQLGKNLQRYGIGDVNARQGDKKLRKVAKQAMQYILVFLLTYGLGLVNYLAVLFYPNFESYALDLSALVFQSSQGTFTFVVYILPRYERWRKEAGESRWIAIKMTIRDEQPTRGRKSSAMTTRTTRKSWVQSALILSSVLLPDRPGGLPAERSGSDPIEHEDAVVDLEPEDAALPTVPEESREQTPVLEDAALPTDPVEFKDKAAPLSTGDEVPLAEQSMALPRRQEDAEQP